MTLRGRLITLEGGEGRQVDPADAPRGAPETAGCALVTTREPGGTPGAEAVRELLIRGAPERWAPMSETLLLLAARRDHVDRVIGPALAAGQWVLCDRFSELDPGLSGSPASSASICRPFHCTIFADLAPALTLILDVPATVGLARREAGRSSNRFEEKTLAYHERVRAGFLAIARAEPDRCRVIDATRPESAVADSIRVAVGQRFGLELNDTR